MKSCPTPRLSLPKGFISGLAIHFEVRAPFQHWHCLAHIPAAVTVSRSESTDLRSKIFLQERTPTFGDMARSVTILNCNKFNLIEVVLIKKTQIIKCKHKRVSLHIKTTITATLGISPMLPQRNLHTLVSQTQAPTSVIPQRNSRKGLGDWKEKNSNFSSPTLTTGSHPRVWFWTTAPSFKRICSKQSLAHLPWSCVPNCEQSLS